MIERVQWYENSDFNITNVCTLVVLVLLPSTSRSSTTFHLNQAHCRGSWFVYRKLGCRLEEVKEAFWFKMKGLVLLAYIRIYMWIYIYIYIDVKEGYPPKDKCVRIYILMAHKDIKSESNKIRVKRTLSIVTRPCLFTID